ncbi:hypothetical protein M768_15140 [Cellulosimicrobium cellulans F16]|uniref:Transcobalamin-like C-terminal domain-containing protein n=2 Tax=Cellulosimicrobium TaxID=157920 RepID=A0A0H2L2X1_9MICO|nr:MULTISPECIES: DUF4430 domain-containing protein [Cellulosimicrobium]KLN34467.1 hypothetical protein FB00_12295 [Cellulosimicrobium funkei]KON72304.1 hypothetical protein M768_15140 [Cellulosimicrobium cellulans F16]
MTLRTFRDTPARPLTALTAVLLTAGLLAGCSSTDEPETDATTSTASEETSAPADDATDDVTDEASDDESGDTDDAPELSYEGRAGTTALDLLLEADPSAQVTGEGENAFVTAIDGVAADPDSEFWALYVNGEMATVGAGSLETEDGDEITWKLETFTS